MSQGRCHVRPCYMYLQSIHVHIITSAPPILNAVLNLYEISIILAYPYIFVFCTRLVEGC